MTILTKFQKLTPQPNIMQTTSSDWSKWRAQKFKIQLKITLRYHRTYHIIICFPLVNLRQLVLRCMNSYDTNQSTVRRRIGHSTRCKRQTSRSYRNLRDFSPPVPARRNARTRERVRNPYHYSILYHLARRKLHFSLSQPTSTAPPTAKPWKAYTASSCVQNYFCC